MLWNRKHILTFFNGWSAALALFFVGILLYSSAGRDDVFKTLFPAWTLSEFGQILNYNGDAIEQSSSLLQVLLVGFFHKILGGNIVQLGHLLAVVCGMATVMFSPLVARQVGLSERMSRWVPWLVAGSSFMTYWSWGGLDASLAALCMLLLLDSLQRWLPGGKPWYFGAVALAFVLVRPENLLVGLLAIGVLAAYSWRRQCKTLPLRRLGLAALMLLGVGLAVFALRWWLFGSLVPLPVRAKGGSLELARIYRGATYYFWAMWRHPEFLLLMLGALTATAYLIWKKAAEKVLVVLAIALASACFVLFSGGDWMENGRFLVPMVPLLAILLLVGLEQARPNWLRLLPWGLLLVSGWGLVHTARHHSTGKPLWATIQNTPDLPGFTFAELGNRVHARDLEMCHRVKALRRDWSPKRKRVTILSQQAGMVIFHAARAWFRQVSFIDLVGLSTPDFLDCEVTQGRGATYGGLNMDLFYLLEDAERLQQSCGFELPDIIFDLDNERHEKENFLSQHGYYTLYRLEGQMMTDDPSFPGLPVGAGQILMLREGAFYENRD